MPGIVVKLLLAALVVMPNLRSGWESIAERGRKVKCKFSRGARIKWRPLAAVGRAVVTAIDGGLLCDSKAAGDTPALLRLHRRAAKSPGRAARPPPFGKGGRQICGAAAAPTLLQHLPPTYWRTAH